jgi:hypothetical protein
MSCGKCRTRYSSIKFSEVIHDQLGLKGGMGDEDGKLLCSISSSSSQRSWRQMQAAAETTPFSQLLAVSITNMKHQAAQSPKARLHQYLLKAQHGPLLIRRNRQQELYAQLERGFDSFASDGSCLAYCDLMESDKRRAAAEDHTGQPDHIVENMLSAQQ